STGQKNRWHSPSLPIANGCGQPYVSAIRFCSQVQMARAFVFVLDSFGIGGAADAGRYGDQGANTFGHIAEACASGAADRLGLRSGPLSLPNMASLGLGGAAETATGFRFDTHGNNHGVTLLASSFHGAAQETSSGKDTPSGHWEIA